MTIPVKFSINYFYKPDNNIEGKNESWIKVIESDPIKMAKAYFSDISDDEDRKNTSQYEEQRGMSFDKLLLVVPDENLHFPINKMYHHYRSNGRASISKGALAKSKWQLIKHNQEAIGRRQNQKTVELANYISAIKEQKRLFPLVNNCFRKYGDYASSRISIEETDNGLSIIDEDIPFWKTITRLIVRPTYCRDPYPSPFELMENYLNVRSCRANAIQYIITNSKIGEYALYDDGVLIAEKKKHQFKIFDQTRYSNCLKILDQSEIIRRIFYSDINPHFVKRTLEQKYIPIQCQKKLESFLGKQIMKALNEYSPCGETRSRDQFHEKEIQILDTDMQILFIKIQFLLQKEYWIHSKPKPIIRYNHVISFNNNDNQFQAFNLSDFKLNDSKTLQLICYLNRKKSLKELPLTAENARDYLTRVKLIDLTTRLLNKSRIDDKIRFRNSYSLRSHLLQLDPSLQSSEAYTATPHEERMKNPEYLMQPSNWISQRVGMQAQVVTKALIATRLLSQSFTNIIATRGNTGSGKSSFASTDSLNPDTFKASLKKDRKKKFSHTLFNRILNKQVHQEGANLFWKFFKEITQNKNLFYSLDSRLLEPEYVDWTVIEPAQKRGVGAEIIDFEVPLKTSLLRVLTRTTYGEDACPSLQPIINGYIQLREYRKDVIERIISNKTITTYQLHYKKPNGEIVLIAKKERNRFEILDHELYAESLRVPSDKEITEQIDQIIDANLIDKAIAEHDIREDQRHMLKPWIGYSLKEAIIRHAG